MNWKEEKQSELNRNIDSLKLIFACKRLYLADYCAELKAIVDLAHYKKIESQHDHSLREDIHDNWILMIKFIDSFEKECLKKSPTNRFADCVTNKTTDTIQKIDAMITSLSLDDDNVFDAQTEVIENLTYDCLHELEQILFQQQTLFFFGNSQVLQDYMNPETMFGKLIFIRNSHFGTRGVEFLIK